MTREVDTPHKFGDKPWLGFEHVTMTPLCKKLVDVNLLTGEERRWIDEYHKEIWDKTSGYFEGDEKTTKWLKRETVPLSA
jgi:Xaa-Pro aminopeptidase